MSLLGKWPSWAGLPEKQGEERKAHEQMLKDFSFKKIAEPAEKRLAAPIDQRIEKFLTEHLASERGGKEFKFPPMMALERHGLARTMSVPCNGDKYQNNLISSTRCLNGVVHNPVNDKRTTKGVFHVAEGSHPIADDKKTVPLCAFSRMLDSAMNPPKEYLELPFTVQQESPAKRAKLDPSVQPPLQHTWVRLHLRPLICPEVPGYCTEKRMEVRVCAPGSMIANVDFLESVFGNAGDALLPENDAALDAEHFGGVTGCIILAPHLLKLKKKDLGLPHWDHATELQRRDSMAWKDPEELYNDGGAFKISIRTSEGFFVTMISDNYFGYCKKEVKTQCSFTSNIFGTEEEHAGGALAWASMSWGPNFVPDYRVWRPNHHYGGHPQDCYKFADSMKLLGDRVEVKPGGYAVDKQYPDVIYVPEDAVASTATGRLTWKGGECFLVPDNVYILPSGYQVQLKQHLHKMGWHITGTVAEPMNCHKPSTVSGGGKSEISKLLSDMITFGTVRIDSVKRDLAYVDMILKRDYSDRYRNFTKKELPLLDPKRTLGSIVKLLTPSPAYTKDYNDWLVTIPAMIRNLVFLVKYSWKPSWGEDWKSHVNVQFVDGQDSDVVHIDGERVEAQYLRIGRTADKRDRKFQLRFDFVPASKIQTEDDISTAIVLPRQELEYLNPEIKNPSIKLLKNCELRLFQRPDDAIERGCDTRCELDMSGRGCFMSNFDALTGAEADTVVKDAVNFDKFTEAMKRNIAEAAEGDPEKYVVSSNHFRMVNGKPTANPRYLQVRTDYTDPRANYVAEVAARLRRQVPADKPVHFPVRAVLPGRRNNPPDYLADGTFIRPLAVFNPIHFQDLPELFMEYVSSLTGKSPSTTGAGSEGALTKGPFNAIRFAPDLNCCLVGMILTGYHGFSSAAGYIGLQKVEHDISLLVPEIWCRMSEEERDPEYLINHGYLEKVDDLECNGQTVWASRLGYRITALFAHHFLGRIFNSPMEVFDKAMLQPETQDFAMFVDGVNNITEAQAKAAKAYIRDGTINDAIPPLKAILYIMADGKTPEGYTADAPEVRKLFKREHLLSSEWYRARLLTKQRVEMMRLTNCINSLKDFLSKPENKSYADGSLALKQRLQKAEERLQVVSRKEFVDSLVGTAGSDPTLEPRAAARFHA